MRLRTDVPANGTVSSCIRNKLLPLRVQRCYGLASKVCPARAQLASGRSGGGDLGSVPEVSQMRRLSILLAVALSALLVAPGAALAQADDGPADAAGADTPVVLAVDDEPIGPDPAPRDAEENPARDLGDYGDRETPFTWAAAWLLAGLGFVGLAVMLAFYRFRVLGPQGDRAST